MPLFSSCLAFANISLFNKGRNRVQLGAAVSSWWRSWEQLGAAESSLEQLVEKLKESIYRFLVDKRDLTLWISDIETVISAEQLAKVLYFFIKGTVSRDFLLLVLFMNQFPPAPDYTIRAVSIFFENSRRYSQLQVCHRYQLHRRQICHRCKRHRWQTMRTNVKLLTT